MKTLIIVDMQNDFITGPLGTPEARQAEQNIADRLLLFSHDHIYLTRDTHFHDYLETQEGQKLPIPHCIFETNGWQISDPIMEAVQLSGVPYTHINKTSFGFPAWKETNLKGRADDLIILVGVCTDICVISNALILKALYPKATIRVLSALCAGTTPENHKKALDIMESCQIDVI